MIPGEVAQQRGELVHLAVQLAVGDRHRLGGLGLGHEDDGRLVPVLGQVAVHAVVAGVQLAADEPLPERRLAGVQRGVPVLVPAQHVGVGPEAFRVVVFAEPLENIRVSSVGLGDEPGRRVEVRLLAPVDRYLCLGGFYERLLTICHCLSFRWTMRFQSCITVPVQGRTIVSPPDFPGQASRSS
jgi:hypothetical protein